MHNIHPTDDKFDRAMKFANNMKEKRPGISNIYVFTKKDKDGNILDEKYGMNLMTNNGFRLLYTDNNATLFDGSVLKLYVGSGGAQQTPPATTDTWLFNSAFNNLAATNTNNTKAYDYPIYFAESETSERGIITIISKFLEAEYGAHIPAFEGISVRLNEFGLATAVNSLVTHSLIYDQNGNKTDIIKDDGTILDITVYMCMSFYEEVITDGWNFNRYTVITSNEIMYSRMGFDDTFYVYKRGLDGKRICPSQIEQKHIDTSSLSLYKLSLQVKSWVLLDGVNDNQGYFDGFVLSANGFSVVEPQLLAEPENAVYTNLWSNDPAKYSGFADKFGMYPSSAVDYTKEQWPQLTRLTNAKAYLYDYKTNGWNDELDLHNPDNKCYDDTPGQMVSAIEIHYFNNGTMHTGYLYQNIYTDDPILSVESGAVTLYATNRYWLPSSTDGNTDPDAGWVWIRDYTDIPANCRSARYWISNTNADSIQFVRSSDCFKLYEKGTTSTGYASYTEEEFGEMQYGLSPQCSNYDYGWFKYGNTVYVPAQHRCFNNIGVTTSETMTFGKWMVIFENGADNTILYADMSNAATTGTFTMQSLVLDFSANNIKPLTQTYRSESGTGYICIQSRTTQESVVLNLTGNSITQTRYTWKMSCCIWGTNKAAYITTTSGDDNVYIRNLTTDTQDGSAIPFPTGVSTVPMLFGYSNYVWMTSSSSTYVVDLTTRSVQSCTNMNTIYDSSNLYAVKMTCVDDVFIIYRYTGGLNIPHAFYVLINTPTVGHQLTDFNRSNDHRQQYLTIILKQTNKYTTNSVTHSGLALMITRQWNSTTFSTNGADNVLYDFGQYLSRDPKSITGITRETDATIHDMCGYIVYGDNIIRRLRTKIPIPNLMPIKLTGKTRTISATNSIKTISGKRWLITFNNNPLWSGKPPGRPVATTDMSGTITHWDP